MIKCLEDRKIDKIDNCTIFSHLSIGDRMTPKPFLNFLNYFKYNLNMNLLCVHFIIRKNRFFTKKTKPRFGAYKSISHHTTYYMASLDTILTLLFFLSFHYSPKQNSVWWLAPFWISHFFWQLKNHPIKNIVRWSYCLFLFTIHTAPMFFFCYAKMNSACQPSSFYS